MRSSMTSSVGSVYTRCVCNIAQLGSASKYSCTYLMLWLNQPPIAPETLTLLRVRRPAFDTPKIPNLGTLMTRRMLLSLPLMPIAERITGKPIGRASVVLLICVSTRLLRTGSEMLSGPRPGVQKRDASLFAATIARANVHRPFTLMWAAWLAPVCAAGRGDPQRGRECRSGK